MSSTGFLDPSLPDGSADATLIGDLFDSVIEDQFAVNQRTAARAETLAELVAFTRSHPHVYAYTGDADAARIAERALLRDAALRLGLSENTIRGMVATAQAATEKLPRLWRRARDGYAAFTDVEAAVALLPALGDAIDVTTEFDTALADAVVRLGSTGFRAFARRTARRLSQVPPDIRHRDAAARRRVIVEPAADGMAWLSAYLPLPDAVAVKRRLTSTAKHLAKTDRDGRTRDQIRADLLSAWLRGAGTPTAVKTKILLTVPVSTLTGLARTTVRGDRGRNAGPDLNREPLIDATTPVDTHTAVATLLREGSFTRVFTDPVTGVILDMDRRARTATRAQVDWLTLAYATCAVDGCDHPAADADIDHWLEYHAPHGGPTNLTNLHPLCGNDHTLATLSQLLYERAPDGIVHIHSPARRPVTDPDDLHDDHGDPAVDDQHGEPWHEPPDDPDEIRRITSARAGLHPPDYGDDPPF